MRSVQVSANLARFGPGCRYPAFVNFRFSILSCILHDTISHCQTPDRGRRFSSAQVLVGDITTTRLQAIRLVPSSLIRDPLFRHNTTSPETRRTHSSLVPPTCPVCTTLLARHGRLRTLAISASRWSRRMPCAQLHCTIDLPGAAWLGLYSGPRCCTTDAARVDDATLLRAVEPVSDSPWHL